MSFTEIVENLDRDPQPLGVRIEDLIYSGNISGQDLTTGRIPESLDEQFDLAFANMRALVERAGAGIDNIAHVTFYLRNLPDRAGINRPWLAMFPDEHDRPTYKFMEADLAPGRLVQLQVFAVANARRQLLNIPGIAHGNPIPMGVKIGKYLFTSRILPADPRTGKNGEGPEQQTMFAFHNLINLIELAGGKPEDVTEAWIFLKDAACRPPVDKVWTETFSSGGPVRHDIIVDLPGNLLVMAECRAVLA